MPDETIGILVETRANTAGLVDAQGRLLELTTTVEKNTVATEENVAAQEQQAETLNALSFSSRRAQSAFVGVAFAMDAFTRSTAAGEGALRRTLRAIDMLAFSLGPELGIPITIVTGLLDSMFDEFERSQKAAEKAAEANAKFAQSLKDLWDENSSGFEQAFRQEGDYITRLAKLQAQQLALTAQSALFAKGGIGIPGVPGSSLIVGLLGGKSTAEDIKKNAAAIKELTKEYEAFEVVYKHIQEEFTGVEAVKTAKLAAEAAKKAQEEALQAARDRIRQVRDEEKQAAEARKEELARQKAEGGVIGTSQLSTTTELWAKQVLGDLYPKLTGKEPLIDVKAIQQQLEALPGGTGFLKGLHDGFKNVDDATTDWSLTLGTIVGEMMPSLEEGFVRVFEVVGRGGNVFKAMAAMAKQAIAEIAERMAMEEFAQGLAMLARSLWDLGGPNPLAFASAAKHFAAAAAFGIVAGIAGAGGGASGGGGGGGGYAGTFLPNSVGAMGGGVTVVVQTVDPWSRSVVNNTVYEINRAGMLNTPVVAPYGRPS